MKFLSRWLRFTKERFDPLSYSMMIITLFGAHYAVYSYFVDQKPPGIRDMIFYLPLVAAVLVFFFKLRLYDEVKDFEDDSGNHPGRPLPRGLVEKGEVFKVILGAILSELLLFGLYGLSAVVSALAAVAYSLLMYKEFFISKWIRPHLTVYAVSHTFVVVFISLAIFTSLFKRPVTELPFGVIYFSLGSWFVFNIFEFGRKTHASKEEREGINSYSKIYGRYGAVALVVAMAVSGILFVDRGLALSSGHYLFLCLFPLVAGGSMYAVTDKEKFSRLYRAAASIYIILFYGACIFVVR